MKSNSPAATASFTALPRPLKIFLGMDLGLLAIAVACEVFCRFVLKLAYPYRFPLLNEHFLDLLNEYPRFQHFRTLLFFTDATDPLCMYPAPVLVIYRFFFLFVPHQLIVFLSFIALSFLVATVLLGRALIHSGLGVMTTWLFLGIMLLTSYPLWFEIRQSNMEITSWVFVSLGVLFYLRSKDYSAATCFGIAGALKIFPFLYLGLLLSHRKYRQIVAGALAAIAVSLPSLWLVYPNIVESWKLTNEQIAKFRYRVMLVRSNPQNSFDHSIFGLFKALFHPLPPKPVMDHLLTLYLATAVVFVLVIYFLRIRLLPVANQILCFCVLSILLPPTSFDYTLMHLYAPWAILALITVQAARQGTYPKGLLAAFTCFAILFAPETEVIFHHWSYGGQIKAVTLIVLFVIALRFPFAAGDLEAEGHDEAFRLSEAAS